MKALTRIIFVDDDGEKFFGEGPYRLLKAVEETGSLHKASATMDMAYTKALKLLSNAEKALGFKLTTRTVGGRSGGGSELTPECKEFLNKYAAYRDACRENNKKLYDEYFCKE